MASTVFNADTKVIASLFITAVFLCCMQSSEAWLWSSKKKINGGWSAWSSWTSCQEGTGKDPFPFRSKQRSCTNPAPSNGGRECGGQKMRKGPCEDCNLPLGMENLKIKDAQITASSAHENFPASESRLNGFSSWCATDLDGEVYLQIDLKFMTLVTAIATQGFYPDKSVLSLRQGRVGKYQLAYSDDGKTWAVYKNLRNENILSGNVEKEGTVLNVLEPYYTTRYIRIYPRSFFSFICMKLEIYGCRFRCGGFLPPTPGDLIAESSETRDVECLWQVTLPSGNVNLDFVNFRLPCSNGIVEVRGDGLSYGESAVLAQYCGEFEVTPRPVMSSSNKLWIRFRSNSSQPSVGFYAVYFPSCNAYLTNNSGVIKSPNHPNEYYHNSRCTWLVTVAQGKAIRLKFSSFQVEGDSKGQPQCSTDHLTIWDGVNNTAPIIGKHCNSVRPPTFICSSGNTMKITFKTDDALAFAGFLIMYQAIEPNSSCAEPSSSIITPTPTLSVMPSTMNMSVAPMIPEPTATFVNPTLNVNITGGLPPLNGASSANSGHLGKKKKDDDEDNGLTTIIIVAVFSFIVLCMIIASIIPSLRHRCEKQKHERLSRMAATEVILKDNEYELQPLQANPDETADVIAVDEVKEEEDDDDTAGGNPSIAVAAVQTEEEKIENDDYGNFCDETPLDAATVDVVSSSSHSELGCDLEYDTTDLKLSSSYENLGTSFASEMAAMISKFEQSAPMDVFEKRDENAPPRKEVDDSDESEDETSPLMIENQVEKPTREDKMRGENSKSLCESNSLFDTTLGAQSTDPQPTQDCMGNPCEEETQERRKKLENPVPNDEGKSNHFKAEVLDDGLRNDKLQKALSDLKSTLSRINSESGSLSEIGNSKTNSALSSNISLPEHGTAVDLPVWEEKGTDYPTVPKSKIKKGSHLISDSKDSGCSSSSECEYLPPLDQNDLERGAETCV
ncbi:uncharacterized protein LOC5508096 [Nematostella vectensis]|uniref:uncharacterized protein LOC5508096 n=1 Tax=Nematostella vectensis TaxID=45351 RepID=UPI0020777455|nr:uncharacterized protein LOC5508096 [Nematostella vectensis]